MTRKVNNRWRRRGKWDVAPAADISDHLNLRTRKCVPFRKRRLGGGKTSREFSFSTCMLLLLLMQ